MLGYHHVRLGSVPPRMAMNSTRSYQATSSLPRARSVSNLPRVSVASSGYRPSYCAAPAKYFGPAGASVSVAAVGRSRPQAALYHDSLYKPIQPRQFGSRIVKGYRTSHVRPEIYEQSYHQTFAPGMGRDSWTSYRISDSALDGNDDLAYVSRRRDEEAIRKVNEEILPSHARMQEKLHRLALAARYGVRPPPIINRGSPARFSYEPIPRHTSEPRSRVACVSGQIENDSDWAVPRVIRSAMPSVEARLLNAKTKAKTRAASVPPHAMRTTKVRQVVKTVPVVKQTAPSLYKAPAGRLQYTTSTVNRGVLSGNARLAGREDLDLSSPSGTMGLRMRLANAQALSDKHRMMIGRFSKTDDDVTDEVRRIKNQKAMRAQSVWRPRYTRFKRYR